MPGETAPLVAAGSNALDPTGSPGLAAQVDLARLRVETVETFYELTTPPATPFAFDVLFRGRGNAGRVCVSVAHALVGGATPPGASETLADAGLLVNGPGTSNRGVWLEATGDGFSRMSVRGAIDEEQVLALQVCDDGVVGTALVRISHRPRVGHQHRGPDRRRLPRHPRGGDALFQRLVDVRPADGGGLGRSHERRLL